MTKSQPHAPAAHNYGQSRGYTYVQPPYSSEHEAAGGNTSPAEENRSYDRNAHDQSNMLPTPDSYSRVEMAPYYYQPYNMLPDRRVNQLEGKAGHEDSLYSLTQGRRPHQVHYQPSVDVRRSSIPPLRNSGIASLAPFQSSSQNRMDGDNASAAVAAYFTPPWNRMPARLAPEQPHTDQQPASLDAGVLPEVEKDSNEEPLISGRVGRLNTVIRPMPFTTRPLSPSAEEAADKAHRSAKRSATRADGEPEQEGHLFKALSDALKGPKAPDAQEEKSSSAEPRPQTTVAQHQQAELKQQQTTLNQQIQALQIQHITIMRQMCEAQAEEQRVIAQLAALDVPNSGQNSSDSGKKRATSPPPPYSRPHLGNFSHTSRDIILGVDKQANGRKIMQLIARCEDPRQILRVARLDLNKHLTNTDGRLCWSREGNFAASCKDIMLVDGGKVLVASARTLNGSWVHNRVELDERVENKDGALRVL